MYITNYTETQLSLLWFLYCTEEDAVRVWPELNFQKILTHLIIRLPSWSCLSCISNFPSAEFYTFTVYICTWGILLAPLPWDWIFASVQLYIVRAESLNTYFQTQKVYPQLQSLLLTEFSTNFQVLCYFLCLEFSDFPWPTNVWFLAWILPL